MSFKITLENNQTITFMLLSINAVDIGSFNIYFLISDILLIDQKQPYQINLFAVKCR